MVSLTPKTLDKRVFGGKHFKEGNLRSYMEKNTFITEGKENTNGRGSSFRKLLDKYLYKHARKGELLEGEVLQVDQDQILVDVGTKRDAVVPREDLQRIDEKDLGDIDPGDQVPVKVLRSPTRFFNKLIVSLSRGLEKKDWDRAEQLLENADTEEAEIVGMNRGGLLVRFGKLTGFIPNSHVPGLRRGTSAEEKRTFKMTLMGSRIAVVPLDVNRRRSQLVLSGKNAERALAQKRIQELQIGDRLHGRVKDLVDFGAFVDLGGIDGLVHISEISWRMIEDPQDVLNVGDEIEVEVIKVDVERQRVGLSRKNLLPDPWQMIDQKYAVGDLVEGKVTNVVDFGVFVELPEGIEGLIHKSELGVVGFNSPGGYMSRGDDVLVRIVDTDATAKRMSLSISQVTYDEQVTWMEERQMGDESPDHEVAVESQE
jgi:small subunit ribosomal protein S1